MVREQQGLADREQGQQRGPAACLALDRRRQPGQRADQACHQPVGASGLRDGGRDRAEHRQDATALSQAAEQDQRAHAGDRGHSTPADGRARQRQDHQGPAQVGAVDHRSLEAEGADGLDEAPQGGLAARGRPPDGMGEVHLGRRSRAGSEDARRVLEGRGVVAPKGHHAQGKEHPQHQTQARLPAHPQGDHDQQPQAGGQRDVGRGQPDRQQRCGRGDER